MCIRDRQRDALLQIIRSATIPGAAAPLVTSIMVALGGVEPVSYTHLRAHETPEHLVCRPMLEKKNTRNSNSDDIRNIL